MQEGNRLKMSARVVRVGLDWYGRLGDARAIAGLFAAKVKWVLGGVAAVWTGISRDHLMLGTLVGLGVVMAVGLFGPLAFETYKERQLEKARSARLATLPKKKQPPIFWSRFEWTNVLRQSGLVESVYRRRNPSGNPVGVWEDHHARTVIENKMLEDFREDHASVVFEKKQQLLAALRSWARKRAYEEWKAADRD